MEVATLILAGIGAIGAVATATARWVSVYRTKQSDQRTIDRERSALRRALYEKIVHNTLGLNKDYWRGVARDAGLESKDIEFALSYYQERRALDSGHGYDAEERQLKASELDARLRRILLD